MKARSIFLTGTGALAKAIIDALTAAPIYNLHVHIYSRDHAKSKWLAEIGNTRSFAFNTGQVYSAGEVDWQSDLPLSAEMERIKPFAVVHTASLQSMWSLAQHNKWSELVKRGGYGTTLPLQCMLAGKIARSVAAMQDPPLLINCCYPDVVNYVLSKCGMNIFSGIGNIAIIDALLSTRLQHGYRMLANHFHVQELIRQPAERKELPRLWIEKKEIDTTRIFQPLQLINDPLLNSITALSCANLLSCILDEKDRLLHLPGPQGLPGGYPVNIVKGKIEAIGTGILQTKEEQSWNKRILEKEGLLFADEGMHFSGHAFEGMKQYSMELAQGFSFSDATNYFEEFNRFVQDLSGKP